MSTTKKKAAKGSNVITIYETLRDEILSLVLEPSVLIDEVSLATRFNVSRSPVREAIVRLVSESMLQTLPNKGTIVAPLRIEEFPQYIDALDLLQRAVTRLAAKHRTDADISIIESTQGEFSTSLCKGDVLGMILANRDLHIAIARAGKNRYLEQSYQQLLDDGRRFLRLYFRAYGDVLPEELSGAHEDMINAIKNCDTDAAERLAHEHTLEMQRSFLRYLGSRHINNLALSV